MSEKNHIKTYLIIYVVLLILTVLTVKAAYIEFGPWNIPIALGIAISKATLVVLFFMHAIDSSRLVKLFIVAGFSWLLLLFGFIYADYMTRSWHVTEESTTWVGKTASYYADTKPNRNPIQ